MAGIVNRWIGTHSEIRQRTIINWPIYPVVILSLSAQRMPFDHKEEDSSFPTQTLVKVPENTG